VRIGVLGQGTVGGSFSKLLRERQSQIELVTGTKISEAGTLTRSSGSFTEILDNADVIVEAIGGVNDAADYVTEALQAKKHVITANKQLLAEQGQQLWRLAKENQVQLRFEAAVGGVVPIVRTIQEALAVSPIDAVHGIVNGTTNFILSEMESKGLGYQEALGLAQEKGYAESDPADDVQGRDAAAKLAILSLLAFGTTVNLSDIAYRGIEEISPADINYASKLGLSIKLLASAERIDGGLSVSVEPVFLDQAHPLSQVHGSHNAVMIESTVFNEITLSGPGAGGNETATAVLGDLISIITGGASLPEHTEDLQITSEIISPYYLHLEISDRPGVLSEVAQVLADLKISIESVVQEAVSSTAADAQLILVLHQSKSTEVDKACQELAKLKPVHGRPRAVRVMHSSA
jgi:homoserine dehydrogenase